jgi:hypothetical protein
MHLHLHVVLPPVRMYDDIEKLQELGINATDIKKMKEAG